MPAGTKKAILQVSHSKRNMANIILVFTLPTILSMLLAFLGHILSSMPSWLWRLLTSWVLALERLRLQVAVEYNLVIDSSVPSGYLLPLHRNSWQ